MSDKNNVIRLFSNNYISVITITLITYEYLFLFEQEVKFVWQRKWTPMSYIYLVARYLGIFLALVVACWGGLIYMPEVPYVPSYRLNVLKDWGFSVYVCCSQVILIWRLYILYNRSKRLLYVLVVLFLPVIALWIGTDVYLYSRRSVLSVKEIVTPIAKYCTGFLHIRFGPAIYGSVIIVCYDVVLAVLAAAILVKHIRERREVKLRPTTYMIMIVRCHIIYFVLNLVNQIFIVILLAPVPTPMKVLSEFVSSIAPYIYVPRLIISIWDTTHAHDECAHVSTTFADCVRWISPPSPEEHEMPDSQITV